MKMMARDAIQLLDVVALVRDRPDLDLRRGSVGTVVEVYGPDAFEVEFVAGDGHTYGLHTLSGPDLMRLRYEPERAAHGA